MNIQETIELMSKSWRQSRGQYHLTLGKVIKQLGSETGSKVFDSELPIEFIDGGSPCSPHSYRGYYSDLAFETGPTIKVKDFLEMCQKALGKTFVGYKGGDFVMGEDTPLWRANYGCCGEAIMGMAIVHDTKILLTTQLVD